MPKSVRSEEEYKAVVTGAESSTKSKASPIGVKEMESLESGACADSCVVGLAPAMDQLDLKALTKPILLCISVASGGFLFGWDMGTCSGVTNMPSFKDHFGTRFNQETGLHEFPDILIGAIISIFNIGCALGGLTLARLGDMKGRKVGIYASILVYVCGIIIQVARNNSWVQFFIGRIITGYSVGATIVLIPMFVAESAPLKIRGSMVIMYQLSLTFGIFAGGVVNYLVKEFLDDNQLANSHWQLPISLGLVIAAIVACGTFLIPESACYLAARGDIEGAKRSFSIMNAMNINDPAVAKAVAVMAKASENDIADSLIEDKKGGFANNSVESSNFWEFITGKPRLGLRLFIGIMVMALQQLTGVNYFFYYGTVLFSSVGLDDSYVTSLILGAIDFGATFIGIYLVEKIGRRMCLVAGSMGMFVCMLVYSCVGSFAFDLNAVHSDSNKAAGAVMVLFTCIYVVFFAATSGSVTIVLISELFPIRTRNISMAICTSVNWFVVFLITLWTPSIASKIDYKFGFVFTACLLFSAIFFYKMVPETKGLTIEQVDALYEEPKEKHTVSSV